MVKLLTLNTDGSFLELNPPTTSAGVGSAGQVPALASTGKLDISFMPTGVGSDTVTIIASESLAAGDFVNIWNNTGTPNVRKALATDATKPCTGFVLTAYSASAPAMVYTRGLNSQVAITGLTIADVGKKVFLSPSAAGGVTTTLPSTSGNIAQLLGTIEGVGATATINFSENVWTVRA